MTYTATRRATQSRLWTPKDASSGLSAWYDASDLNTIILNGSTVSQWKDKSGNGNNVSQSTGSKQPTFSSVFPSYLSFTSASSQYLTATTVNGLAIGSNPSTVYGIARPTATSGYLFGYGAQASGENRGLYVNGAGYVSVWFNAGPDLQTATAWPSVLNITGGSYGTTTATAYLNGVNIGSKADVPNTIATYPMMIGASIPQGSPSGYWSGSIYEIIIVNGLFDPNLDAKITGYAAAKYGFQSSLPVSHQYKFQPPRVSA